MVAVEYHFVRVRFTLHFTLRFTLQCISSDFRNGAFFIWCYSVTETERKRLTAYTIFTCGKPGYLLCSLRFDSMLQMKLVSAPEKTKQHAQNQQG